tara:strand:+ start:9929 stop:10732 length:804 start_codon:yes stop_codon:yes gene_type:complete
MRRLREIINGDSRDGAEILSTYRSGPDLISLFNEYGRNDRYQDGFPSRWQYTEERLRELNGKSALGKLVEEVFDPLEFESEEHAINMFEYANPAFERDGWRLVLESGRARLRSVSATILEPLAIQSHEKSVQEFVDEHLEKCRQKLDAEDYSGAITNARSLVEAVLSDAERKLDPDAASYNGDLPKLQKRVHKLLAGDRASENETVIQLLRGLEGVIGGLSGTSNKMGDRHSGATVRARRHHARLAVNCAFSLCDFYVEALSSRAVP